MELKAGAATRPRRVPPPAQRGYARWVVAPALVGVSMVLRLGLASWFGADIPYLPFFPAILGAAWYGGFGPGVLATALSAPVAMFWFLPPDGQAAAGAAADIVSLVVFCGIGLGISWTNHLLRMSDAAHRSLALLTTGRAERLDAIINTTVDGIIVIDDRGTIEAFNRAAERLFGYPGSDVLGRNVNMLMPSPYREEHDGYLRRHAATGEARIIGTGREVTGLRRDGTTFPLHLSVGQVEIEGQRKFTGILHDLTARVRIEAQLREQASLARLGEMAAVLAHEIKNPLAGMRGALQVMSTRMPAGGSDAAMAGEIIARIDALDSLMKDLLLFARPPAPNRRPTEVGPLVAATANLLKEDAALRQVEVEIAGSAPPVSADAEMLKMVFQNLLVNGAHAMNGRGRIRVDITSQDGACQMLFTDGGPGIPPEVLEKVFTPFFTTKSRGTGLGLPTARRFIEAHDGHIAVTCPPAGGTTVAIRLPLRTA